MEQRVKWKLSQHTLKYSGCWICKWNAGIMEKPCLISAQCEFHHHFNDTTKEHYIKHISCSSQMQASDSFLLINI